MVAGVTGVPAEQSGLASGVLNSARQLGGSLGLAVLVTIAADVNGRTEGPGLADGYTTALLVAAGLLAAGAVVGAVILPGPARDTAPAPVPVT